MTPPVCNLHRRPMKASWGETPRFVMSDEFKGKRMKRRVYKCPVPGCRCVQTGEIILKHAMREPSLSDSYYR